jgi:ATP-dependent DNA helicase RecG
LVVTDPDIRRLSERTNEIHSIPIRSNSRPRNPKIADACFKSGYIDTWGRGTLKIISACAEAGLPEPEIVEKDGGVQVTIYRATIGGQVGGQIGGQAGGQVGGQVGELSDRQREILGLIKENNRLIKRALAKNIKINVSAAQAHLGVLKSKGVIAREGGTRGYWKIIAEE